MRHGRRMGTALALGLAMMTAACTQTAQVKPPAATFFPPAPAPPRIQYLTWFSGTREIEEQSEFNRFVVGENPDRKVNKPYGVAIHDGRIYVCDTNSTVLVFDLKARTLRPLAGAVGAGELRQPLNISIDEGGIKYVADPVRGQVVAFGRNDEYLRAFGTPGAWRPVDAVSYQGRLYVADMSKGQIAVIDQQSGATVDTFGGKGEPSERLDRPTNLAFDRDGFLYVTDVGRFQVVKFDRQGKFQAAFGRPGDNLGHFARPKGIAVDRDGILYAVDASFNNVQMFNRSGRLLMFFGAAGASSLLLPADVTIDYDNIEHFRQYLQPGFEPQYLILATSQFGDRRVHVYAYGRQQGMQYPSDEELLRRIDEKRAKGSGQ